MARNSSVIEINGNRYDAATGKLIGAVKSAVAAVKPGTGKVLDGFTRRSAPATQAGINSDSATNRPLRGGLKKTAQAIHRQAQHSRTLMRTAVTKPDDSTSVKTVATRPATKRGGVINSQRAFRAKMIIKNTRVSRFSPLLSGHSKPVAKPKSDAVQGQILPKHPSAVTAMAFKSKRLVRPLPSMVTSVSHNQLERMLDHALARADAHKQAVKSRRDNRSPWRRLKRLPRWFSAGVVLLVVLATGGLFAWQEVPQLSLRVASSRAHIDASIPGYTPAGFSLSSPVKYASGMVYAELQATDDKAKTIGVMQQASNLDSESLAASTIPAGAPVQTSQVNGTTVYIYGKQGNATWVSKGIKYTIQNKASLSSDELYKIAGSL